MQQRQLGLLCSPTVSPATRSQAGMLLRSRVGPPDRPVAAGRQGCSGARAARRLAPPRASSGAAAYLTSRHQDVLHYFPAALGVDDFIARVEVALAGFGFTGSNSIAMTNLCRDEVTTVLKEKIDAVWGGSFNTNGLGGVLTCGVTGVGAGLSHSPVERDARERYVFFSFPHIGIDSEGVLGRIYRANRPGPSCACGALQKALIELQSEGLARATKIPGVHDPLDPEFTILKQRLARRIRYEQADVRALDLAQLTQLAERVITDDLEYLIEKSVSIDRADFAVVAGVQIHNWAALVPEQPQPGQQQQAALPCLEFVAPTKVYVVVSGDMIRLDLTKLPPLTPRQISLLSRHGGRGSTDGGGGGGSATGSTAVEVAAASEGSVSSTLVGMSPSFLSRRLGGSATCATADGLLGTLQRARPPLRISSHAPGQEPGAGDAPQGPCCRWPSWQTQVQKRVNRGRQDPAVPTMDGEQQAANTSFTLRGLVH